MKQLEVFNKIGGILKELNEQYQYIQADPGNINDLEIELFVANAHFLKDHAEILNKLNQRSHAEKAEEAGTDTGGTKADIKLPAPPMPVELSERNFELPAKPVKTAEPEKLEEPAKAKSFVEKFFEPVVRPIKPKQPEVAESDQPVPEIDLSSETPKDNHSFIMAPPEVIRHELEVDPADSFGDEEVDEEVVGYAPDGEEREETLSEQVNDEVKKPEMKEEPKPETQPEPKWVETQVEPVKAKEDVLTINERMSVQRSGSTHHTEQAVQPVTNLKAAITLNDKLLFIKDLFNGYSLAYSEAIEILNRFNTFEEANRFLTKNYTAKNNWDSKPETAEKFYALLKRRYA